MFENVKETLTWHVSRGSAVQLRLAVLSGYSGTRRGGSQKQLRGSPRCMSRGNFFPILNTFSTACKTDKEVEMRIPLHCLMSKHVLMTYLGLKFIYFYFKCYLNIIYSIQINFEMFYYFYVSCNMDCLALFVWLILHQIKVVQNTTW